MNLRVRPLPFLAMLAFSPALLAGATPLPRSTPEAQGLPSAAVLAFLDAAEAKVDSLHSVMILRHGQVVAEGWWAPYAAEVPHQLYSLSKSFTSTGIGLAAAEGRLKITDPVLQYFPDYAPADASDNLKAMRIRDLLIMATATSRNPRSGTRRIHGPRAFSPHRCRTNRARTFSTTRQPPTCSRPSCSA